MDDKEFQHRAQALDMLGRVCAANPALRPKILTLQRDRIASSDTWTQQGAMAGLATCGTADHIARLQALAACSNQWNVRPLCKLVEGKIRPRLADQDR